MDNFSHIETHLVSFLKEELEKTGLKKVVLGLSGGIDSAVVALLAKKAFEENLLCVMLPSSQSSPQSLNDAKELCSVHNLAYEIIPIGELVDTYSKIQTLTPLRMGNFAARMRMAVLYDVSAREKALVLGTGNKSELLLGYGTLHGDLACAINPIGDIYKSDIFTLARHLGVTQAIISKPPSADLWEGQSDEAELGFSYAKIDQFLKAYVDNQIPQDELIKQGYDSQLCRTVIERIENNRFKLQPTTIAKLDKQSSNADCFCTKDIQK